MNIKKDFKKGKYITLDNGVEYLIVSDIIYDNDKYVFLINPNNVKEQYYALVELVDENVNVNIIDLNANENRDTIDLLSDKFKDDMADFLSNVMEEK